MVCDLFCKKITKLLITQQPLKLEKNNCRFGILKVLEFFDAGLAKFEKQSIFT
jgi:hypothetical protein